MRAYFRKSKLPGWTIYFVAIASAGLAGVLSALLPWRQDTPSPFFTIAVVFSSWLGGMRTGLLSASLSALFWQLSFLSQSTHPNPIRAENIFEIGAFTFAAIVVGTLFSQLRREREQLSELNENLEQRVIERTAKIEESVKALEGVLYTIAHDLRAPLRAMRGFSEILVHEHSANLDEEGKDFCQRIAASSQRMDKLIQDLLEYGNLSQIPVILKQVDLNREIDVALASMNGEIQRRNAHVQVARPLPLLHANTDLLQIVLKNYISNALKFVAPGITPSLRIHAEVIKQKVRLWIEDNGVGIERAYHEKIFLMFHRLENQQNLSETGVGLALARKAAERMLGFVGVQSEPGKGSRFWIDLPLSSPPSSRPEADMVKKEFPAQA